MLRNHLKVAVRHLAREKGYSFINIGGLAVGLTCFILVALYIRFELSYDRFNEKADRIAFVGKRIPTLSLAGSSDFAVTPAPLAETLAETFPEVESATHIAQATSLIAANGTSAFHDGIFADKGLFDVFSYRLLRGDASALSDKTSILLTESLARSYFGDSEAIGRYVKVTHSGENFSGESEMVVAGIVADPPTSSHLKFDFVVPISSSAELDEYVDDWDSNSYLTYVALRPDASATRFADQLARLDSVRREGVGAENAHNTEPATYFPVALTDLHLRSRLNFHFGSIGDIRYVYLFAIIALMILGTAVINYVNLSTARSTTRMLETGVRKTIGAGRGQLAGQYMAEAVVPCVLALAVALVATRMLLPVVNDMVGIELTLTDPDTLRFMILISVGLVCLGVLAGSYPAFLLSSLHPVGMMKGVVGIRPSAMVVRNALVVGQFAIAILLVIGTIAVQRQVDYIRTANTGMNREQVVSIDVQDKTLHERYDTLRDVLLRNTGVSGVTAAQSDPTAVASATRAAGWEGSSPGDNVLVYRSAIQGGYAGVFDLQFVEGRDLDPLNSADATSGLLVNETLRDRLGWETAVGRSFSFFGRDATIVGVVRDFNFASFREAVAPLALYLDNDGWFPYQRILIRLRPGDLPATLTTIEQTFAQFSPDYPFEYHFLDDSFDAMYAADQRLGRLFNYFAAMVIFIACLGLLGLAAFSVQRRRKEIGVRKVLGASSSNIVVLISRHYAGMVGVAFLIAVPFGIVFINRWLQGFAYHVDVGPGTFLVAGITVFAVALLTVGVQALRAATADPVKSLRYD
ncbi:MAG: ABC transporter permease [Rhodothermales bacterium]